MAGRGAAPALEPQEAYPPARSIALGGLCGGPSAPGLHAHPASIINHQEVVFKSAMRTSKATLYPRQPAFIDLADDERTAAFDQPAIYRTC